ncbi:hypothetical protein HDE_08195 [Halotydeus destructor]|nr:hypothetical protein HDE_08195 [Halotydeus destructor]
MTFRIKTLKSGVTCIYDPETDALLDTIQPIKVELSRSKRVHLKKIRESSDDGQLEKLEKEMKLKYLPSSKTLSPRRRGRKVNQLANNVQDRELRVDLTVLDEALFTAVYNPSISGMSGTTEMSSSSTEVSSVNTEVVLLSHKTTPATSQNSSMTYDPDDDGKFVKKEAKPERVLEVRKARDVANGKMRKLHKYMYSSYYS